MQPARTLFFLTVFLGCLPTDAAEWQQLRLGIDGQGKPGRWLPVEVVCGDLPAGVTAELQMTAPDARGDLLTKVVDAGPVQQNGEVRLSGHGRIGRLTGQALLELVVEGQTVLKHAVVFDPQFSVDETPVLQTRLAMRRLDPVTLLTCQPLEGMEEFLRNVAVFSTPEPPIVQHLRLSSVADLPADELGLDMVDLLLLTDDFTLSERQTQAVRNWVYAGGHLIVSSGATVPELRQSKIGGWLDTHFEFGSEPQEIRRFSSLEGFVPGASRIQTSLQNRSAWPVARLLSDQVAVVVDSIDGPLVGRRSIGGGLVTMVAVDVNRLPLKNWTSLPHFYEKLLLGEKLNRDRVTRTRTSRISQSGISDLSTQLLATVDAKPVAGQWSTWSVMALVVIWLVAIGPLDYLLVSRLFRKPHLTWVTFPLMIVAGIAIILVTTGSSDTVHLTQFQMLDYYTDGDEHRVTGRGWVSVSSPATVRIDVAAKSPSVTASETVQPVLSWSGRAEDVFGAMYREGGIGLGRQTFYQKHNEPHRLSQVPLLTGGSRGFETFWSSQTPPVIDSSLRVSGFGLLNGSFRHSLTQPVRDWIIVHGNRVYRPTTAESSVLAPGDRWNAQSAGTVSLELKGFLNASRRIDNPDSDPDNPFNRQTSLQAQSPYDIQSTDRMYIASMISFFEAAGGSEYAELSNAQLRDLEISSTIRLNHAVLLGFVDSEQPVLQTDGIECGSVSSQTLVRLFLPVRRQPAESLARSRQEQEDNSNQ